MADNTRGTGTGQGGSVLEDYKYGLGQATPANPAGVDAATAYGITQNLITQFPELAKVWDLFKAGNITDAKIAYFATDYYRNLIDIAKVRQGEFANQPGVYKTKLEDYKITQRKRLIAAGIADISDATLEEAYKNGWTDNQLDLSAVKQTQKPIGGNALANADYAKQYANQFGMSYSDADYSNWSTAIFSGTTTLEDIKAKIRTDAASSFPAYADQINKGVSVESLASAYKQSIANILEVDGDSISFNNPYLRRALQYVGPDGKPANKPIWEFEKELRSTPEWQYTKNARDTMDSLGLKVFQDWGLA